MEEGECMCYLLNVFLENMLNFCKCVEKKVKRN